MELEKRIARSERALAVMTVAVVVLALVVVWLALRAAPAPASGAAGTHSVTLQAADTAAFEIVDEGGAKRAVLGVAGVPHLEFRDERGRARIVMRLMPNGQPVIELIDARANRRLTFGAFPDGSPTLSFHDFQERTRAMVATDPTGRAHVSLFDENGDTTWTTEPAAARSTRAWWALAECKQYLDFAEQWKREHGSYPDDLGIEDPTAPFDPWGQRYQLVIRNGTARVVSRGPDKEEDTADDISFP